MENVIIQVVVLLIGMIGGAGAILYRINQIGKKVLPFAGMVNATAEGLIPILRSVGLEKVADGLEEGGDVTEAVEKLFSVVTTATEDKIITTAEALAIFNAGKAVIIEAKDFRAKIIPSKQ